MPSVTIRKLFISHSWAYSDAYEKLIAMLDSASNFRYQDYSVPKNDPVHDTGNMAELYQAIKDQMIFCNVILIMAGKYATYSKWIQREIRIAKNDYDKPILAIKPWASTQVSSVVADAADDMVGWNTNSIISAIRRLDP